MKPLTKTLSSLGPSLLLLLVFFSACAPQRDPVKLLSEAGYSDPALFPRLHFLVEDTPERLKQAQVLAAQWTQQMGIEVEISQEAPEAYQKRRDQGQYDLCLQLVEASTPDPALFLTPWTAEKETLTWQQGSRRERFSRFQDFERRLLLERQALIPLYYPAEGTLIQTDLWTGWYSPKSLAPAPQNTRTDFVMADVAGPLSLDPLVRSSPAEKRLQEALFEGLYTKEEGTGVAQPGVAESFSLLGDGQTYLIKLKKTFWSDGTPLLAQAVVGSWTRNPALGPFTAQALDDQTLQLSLGRPVPDLAELLATPDFFVLPIHAIERYGDDWTHPHKFVGNGPFILKEKTTQGKVVLVPNSRYRDLSSVKLTSLTYLPLESEGAGRKLFDQGGVDWLLSASPGDSPLAPQQPGFQATTSASTVFVAINENRPPLEDVRVRRALELSVDRAGFLGA
jgi:ABC-type oligopeptide transport system substrate-binding subunit